MRPAHEPGLREAGPVGESGRAPVVIATIAREQGTTGVHTHVRELRHALERSGHPAELVTPRSWARGRGAAPRRLLLLALFGTGAVLERVSGPAHVWWYRTSHELFLRRALARRLGDAGPCTVYAQCPLAARAALSARSGPHQRVVLAVHFRISQADEWADKGMVGREGAVYRWIRSTERAVVPRVDGLVFVSEWARAAVRAWLPQVGRVPSTVVHNFVADPQAGARTQPGYAVPDVPAPGPPAPGDLVSVGSLEAVKNHRYLLRVLAAARRSGHAYTLDVFGEGVERGRLLALAEELGISDQLRLQGFRRDVADRLPGYRAYVHASYSESSSFAIMEAMAAGLPVLSSSEGALRELFDDGVEGRFWPIDDPEEAARVLVELLEDGEGLAAAARAARRRFLRDYDAAAVAPRLVRFLQADGRGTAAASGSFPAPRPAPAGSRRARR